MGLFSKDKLGVSPAAVDSAQEGLDPRTEGPALIEKVWFDTAMQDGHPWALSDGHLLKLAWASIAFTCDLTAETLRREAVFWDHEEERLDPDVAWFAENMTAASKYHMLEAKGMQLSQYVDGQTFNDETLEAITPENALPWWPRTSIYEKEIWQTDKPEFVAGRRFVGSIVTAAELIQAQAVDAFGVMSGQNPIPGMLTKVEFNKQRIPSLYTEVEAVASDLMTTGRGQLDEAANLPRTLTPDSTAWAYQNAHDGFLNMMTALTAAYCPPVLGRDFVRS